ncbi:MAG: glycosyltransferase family 4 protein [Acidobacteria bacterium]|nr:glycosyltransferase family 4 protein [Acidobacteriota bacterium]
MTVFVNAVGAKMGGAANDLSALLAHLRAAGGSARWVFFVDPSQAELGRNLPSNVELRLKAIQSSDWLRRLWWDQVTLRHRLASEHASVLFSFSDFGLFRSPVPQLLFLRNAVHFSEAFRTRVLPTKGWRFRLVFALRRWLACRSIRAADAFMTPSASMLEMVREAVPLPDGKGEVNYPGAPARGTNGERPPSDYSGTIRLLFPTFYADHKNFATALEALRLLRQRHGARFRLVTTADPRWELARLTSTWKADLATLEELSREGGVEVLGLVPHEKLLALYRQCHVMCYPTLAESFGHPLLEAMQAGLPVVASDIGVNRELARDAALYFSPLDAAQLAARIEEVADNAALRVAMQERGRRYASEFSWTRHAETLLRRLGELAEQPAPPSAGLAGAQ